MRNELDYRLYCMVATPFQDDGSLDEEGLRTLIRRVAGAGNALYMTSPGAGEGHLLTVQEHRRIYEIAVDEARGKVPVGANIRPAHTADGVYEIAAEAIAAGVDIVQIYQFFPPLGMQPSDREQAAYWDEILDRVQAPVAISFNPQVGYVATTKFIVDLCKRHPHIEEINFPPVFMPVRDALPPSIRVNGAFDLIPLGSTGIQLAENNIIPETCMRVIDGYRDGDLRALRDASQAFQRFRDVVRQWHPATSRWVKMAFKLLDLGNGVQRKPYLLPGEEDQRRMAEGFKRLNIPELDALLPARD